MSMKEITVISGKGGTGKTTIAAALASLAKEPVLADCDVDAADLHLILEPDVQDTQTFTGLKMAVKDSDKCIGCGLCYQNCRFGAITEELEFVSGCEGCGVCKEVCPSDAIILRDRIAGEVYRSKTRFGPMAHARLYTAEEASGKLVAKVRETARELAEDSGRELIIIDGPPGIGCPVVASITGVNAVLVVTEPTVSGIHDMKRVLGVASHFSIPAFVCINKSDINPTITDDIRQYCSDIDVSIVGVLPYDNITTEAMIQKRSVVEHSDGEFAQMIRDMWDKILEHMSK